MWKMNCHGFYLPLKLLEMHMMIGLFKCIPVLFLHVSDSNLFVACHITHITYSKVLAQLIWMGGGGGGEIQL